MGTSDGPGTFGLLVQKYRAAAGLSQEELAERSGLSRRGLSDLERGARRTPHPATVRHLAEALRLDRTEHAAFLAAARAGVASPRALAEPEPAERPARRLARTNLPLPSSALLGREREVAAARDRLLREDVRLLTLTGPGGTGKTRLGLHVVAQLMDRFDDGMVFVALAPISDPDLVPAAIAQALEIRDVGGRPVLESLKDYLRERSLLLVLDNFEQVLRAAPVVGELLGASPGLNVLVTSRAPLELRGEHELPVPPLAVPDPERLPSIDDLARYGAVALFIERATAIRPDFAVTNDNAPAVAEVCVRLDGLPLAIELAAARIRVLSPQALLARLERRLPLLTGGARDLPARQQTLRGTIAWSYDLLDEGERTLFRRLAMFVGGCTLDAAAAVCDPDGELSLEVLDGVASLVAKSLLSQEDGPDGEPRVGMLETIREFAWEQLEASGEVSALRDRHLEYFLGLAEAAEPELIGRRQAEWLDRLERENDNLRAALEWSCAESSSGAHRAGGVPAGSRVEAGVRLAGALEFFWAVRGHGRENLPRVMALVALAPRGTAVSARALTVAAHVHGLMLGDHEAAMPLADEAARVCRVLGDAYGLVAALVRCGQSALGRGDAQLAMAFLTEARSHLPELDRQSQATAYTTLFLAEAAQAQGHHDQALALEAALGEAQARGDGHAIAYALRELARLRRRQGERELSAELLGQSLALLQPLKDIRCAQICLEDLAGALSERRPVDVARLFGASDALLGLMGTSLSAARRLTREHEVATVERQLDPQSFAEAWAEGRAMNLEQAIEYALGEATTA